MAIVVKDRVKVTAAAPGTGTITLGSAAAGFQSFEAIGDGNVTYFAIVDTVAGTWEVNYGTYTSSGTTLTRNATPLSSSNSGNLVNFTGTVDVFCTYPSEKAIYEEIDGNTLIDGGPLTIIGANVSPGYTTFSAALAEMYANVDAFAQSYARNFNTGQEASADMIVYRDNTVADDANFLDMGINSQYFSSTTWPIFTPASMYLYGNGGEMFIGSETDDLIFFTGGVDTTDEAGRFDKTTKALTLASDANVGGNLDVTGTAVFGSTVTLNSDPTTALEAATKQYVDNAASTGIHIHTPVAAETSAALSAVYTQGGTTFNITDITGTNTVVTSTTHGLSVNDQIWLYSTAGNGLSTNTAYFVYATPTTTSLQLSTSYGGPLLTGLTNASGLTYATRANSGVGAYLEASANEALPVADVIVGDRVLVYNQSTGYWNGVYTVTDLGSLITKWKLTRATDADYYSPSDTDGLSEGDYFLVQSNSESYVLTTPGAIIIGYTSITYTLFASVPTYTGGTNIDVTGGVISLTGTVAATNGGTGTNSVATGNLLYGSATDTWSKLAVGTTYNLLRVSGGGVPEWGAVNLASSDAVSGTLGATNGGTSQNSYATGDTLYASASNTLSKLSGNTSTTKKFMVQTGTGSASAAPLWDVVNGSDVNGNISGQAGSVANALTAGTYLTGSSFDGSVARTWTVDATSANTASKVVARDSSGDFSAGTITAALSGNATTATTATNVAGGAANKLVYNSSSGTTAFADAPTLSGQYLQWNGSAFAWVTPAASATKGFAVGMSLVFGR